MDKEGRRTAQSPHRQR